MKIRVRRREWAQWPMLGVVVLIVGCAKTIPCNTDADCPANGKCDATTSSCLEPDDGGLKTACAAGCAAWQTCRPETVATGVCVNASIRAVSPSEAVAQTGGNAVSFVFEVTQWDGGVWPSETVPLWKSDEGMVGPGVLTREGDVFRADVQLANKAGRQGVVAGWDAVDAGIFVETMACDVTCRPFEECVADAAGGRCADMGATLAFTTPTEGAEFGPINSQAVVVGLVVTRADGGAFVAPVPFEMALGGAVKVRGVLQKTGASWAGVLDAGVEDGVRVVTAGWDGGPGATRTFRVTATPPTVALIADVAPVRPANQTDGDGQPRWKKSEVAPVRLVSSRDLLEAPTAADFVNSEAVSASSACAEASVAPRCYCFAVDLAQVPFTQAAAGTLYGATTVGFGKQLTDVLGNAGVVDAGVVGVTRLKWSRVVANLPGATPTALAVSADGLVVAGAWVGVSSAIAALRPDGDIAWQQSSGTEAITAGPMAGDAGFYLAVSTGSQGQFRRLGFDGVALPDKCIYADVTYAGDMALVSPGAGEFPIAVARTTSSTNATLMGSSPSNCFPSDPFGKLAAGVRPALIVDGARAYVAASNQAPVWKFENLSGTPTVLGSRSTVTLYPSNLFVAGASIVGGGGPTVGGVFAFFDTGGALDGGATVNAMPGSYPGGAGVVGAPASGDSRPWVYYGDSNGEVQKVRLVPGNPPAFDNLPAPLVVVGADFSALAPVLGGNGEAYVASANVLYALDGAGPSERWHWTAPEAISAQLNLDKNRDAPSPCGPGQPGVLYVVTASGTSATVYALLVDSPGLDGKAPWPRYQHDPGNTGNAGTDLTPWVCP